MPIVHTPWISKPGSIIGPTPSPRATSNRPIVPSSSKKAIVTSGSAVGKSAVDPGEPLEDVAGVGIDDVGHRLAVRRVANSTTSALSSPR